MERICNGIWGACWPNTLLEPQIRSDSRAAIEVALARAGITFRDGRILTGASVVEAPLAEAIRKHDMTAVEKEFQRAISYLSSDPEAAVTAACAILEATFRTILEDESQRLPSECSLKPLWKAVRDHLRLAPDERTDQDFGAFLNK